ncbi:hypothetical protein [Porphyromonas somerae]|uniref:hypothetical protein n=1 Tax=Porphyromonas somerae TaxID=322095 RepID=UPI001FCC2CA6|nr:hypothetical protein [Porphyromonas somerae]BDE81273.1 hypothetical protein CE91St14_03010 [Porphyromonas somerae]
MKTIIKILAVLAVVMAVTACNGSKPKGLLKQGAMVYVNVRQEGLKAMDGDANTGEKLYTPAEIVKEAMNFCLDTPEGDINGLLGISEKMKDYDNNRIKMWGEQIISEDGELVEYFMKCKNVRICNGKYPDKDNHRNIIAYIPNKVMQEGWVKIKKAYDTGNYEEVYRLFQQVYTAIPITPSEYQKLVEKGEN